MSDLGFGKPDDKDSLVGLNTLGWGRNEVVSLPSVAGMSNYATIQGEAGLSQVTDMNRASSHETASIKEVKKDVFLLSNSQFDVEVTNGVITSLYDKHDARELIPKGEKANQLVIFDDKPLYWQAWDVEAYHLNSRKELHAEPGSTAITENGPHRVSVTTTTTISSKSSIKTTISLSAAIDPATPTCIETSADVTWHETMKFLKVEFPVSITNTSASYETQYGIVSRPTHYNTSWDMAKFEVCCHKFADLSENGYGVSILNDSKYGFAVCGNLMRLSLLRAPKAPDAHADMGDHTMRWGILPHKGPLDHRTVRKGYEFNYPTRLLSHPKPGEVKRLLAAFRLDEGSDKGLVLDTIKRAEDDEDVAPRGEHRLHSRAGKSVIVRVYDSLGGRARGRISMGSVKVVKAWKCNLLEDDEEELEVESGGAERVDDRDGDGDDDGDKGAAAGVRIDLRAFEVATYRFLLA